MSLDQYPVKSEDFDGPVLVTGAGGCIGAWVLALLDRAGVPVVALDLVNDKRRPKLLMSDETVDALTWEVGDIADSDRVMEVVDDHDIRAIIHLAALQVPFCKANPINGAKVNVVGTVNVFEAARARDLKRVAFASSIAAHSFFEGQNWLPTLYGAYKYCDEMIAQVYGQDWGVPSVGIRPGVVYGIGRDQGMTSKTTVAILAAAAGRPYTVPFSGAVSGLHAGEVASAFIKAVAVDRDEARMFDHNGVPSTVEDWLEMIRKIAPDAKLSVEGEALPFPADLSDDPIRDYLGDFGHLSLGEGIRSTFDTFQTMLRNDVISADSIR
ncbi:MAG: NAD(P)-dependent oxidoreductase [Alphaproteobacteria bacterium]|nr:NAD(P)-dependent oxidoreductase [Alphaproteobacteria bacterium]